MFSPHKLKLRDTPLPFVPKSAFSRKLEAALKIAKNQIEEGASSGNLHMAAQKLRRKCTFALSTEVPGKSAFEIWNDAHLLDLLALVWDSDFLSTITGEDTPRQLRERAKENMVNGGYLSAIELSGPKRRVWTEPELRQFSNSSKLVAQAEILLEFARVREEAANTLSSKK